MDVPRQSSTTGPAPSDETSSQRLIMVVEDDSALREMMLTLFAAEGFAVIGAMHGREALDLLATYPVAVILLDLMMPVLDGWSFLRQQELCSQIASIPVVVVSAVADSNLRSSRSVVAVVPKPCDFTALLETVRTATLLRSGTERSA